MNRFIYLLILSAILIHSKTFATLPNKGKASLSGKVFKKNSTETLPGVELYFPDLKTGTVTKADGSYTIDNLPITKVLVKVSFLGYGSVTETITLEEKTVMDFYLEESVKEIEEVVITGLSQSSEQKRNPAPVSVITNQQLQQNSSTNIIDAISKEPGISQVSTGPSISKPVIRGLGYNRVVVVTDGIRQEGQQWGDEHGIEVDEYSIYKIEILKGPASLAYGSDAMAGVVNMISALTLPEGVVRGNLISNYQTNNGMIGYSGNISGNIKGFIWDTRFSQKYASCYQNKADGYVLGSKFNETNYSGLVGLNKSWGYSHINFSSYNLQTEITEGERDSITGKFIKPLTVNDSLQEVIAAGKDFSSYTLGTPHQNIQHYKAVWSNSFFIRNGRLNLVAGWQQNNRQEFGDPFNPAQYGLYFKMNTFNYDLRFVFPEKNNIQASIGLNGMKQISENKGTEFLVPAYQLTDGGMFFTAKKSWSKLDISGGLRYDTRSFSTESLLVDSNGNKVSSLSPNYSTRFSSFKNIYSNISGSAGLSYQFNDLFYTKANISRGYRAPNISEIGANGVHEGTARYEIGNNELKPEISLQNDLAFGFNNEHVSAEVNFFYNKIDNFIYLSKLSSILGGDSIVDPYEPVSTFKFNQGNAQLLGSEVSIDIHPHPLDWLHIKNSFSFVNAVQQNVADSMKYLPFTPAPKIVTDLKAEIDHFTSVLKNIFLSLEVLNFLKQDKVFLAYQTETVTPAYTLVNFGIGTDIFIKERKICSVNISINNLLDTVYQNHLSRLKYSAPNYITGTTGVFNMGRNIGFKLIIPFALKNK